MWRFKVLGYVIAIILFAIIFVKGAMDSGLMGVAVFGVLITFAAFLWICIYIHHNENSRW